MIHKGIKTEVVRVTPEVAARILEASKDFRNRTPDMGRVATYAKDMAAGQWALNGETIILDRDGVCIDGQHRLLAVIQAKAAVEMLVVSGVDVQNAEMIDQGKSRTVANAMYMGGVKSASALVAALRSLHELRGAVDPECQTGRRHEKGLTLQSAAEVRVFMELHAPRMPDWLELVPSVIAKVGPVSEFAAAAYEFSLVEDQTRALEWLQGVAGIVDAANRDPRRFLRERFLDDKLAIAQRTSRSRVIARMRVQRLSLMVKAWNLWVGGHSVPRTLLADHTGSSFRVCPPLPAAYARTLEPSHLNLTDIANLRGYRSMVLGRR